jgi:hypothetical protein
MINLNQSPLKIRSKNSRLILTINLFFCRKKNIFYDREHKCIELFLEEVKINTQVSTDIKIIIIIIIANLTNHLNNSDGNTNLGFIYHNNSSSEPPPILVSGALKKSLHKSFKKFWFSSSFSDPKSFERDETGSHKNGYETDLTRTGLACSIESSVRDVWRVETSFRDVGRVDTSPLNSPSNLEFFFLVETFGWTFSSFEFRLFSMTWLTDVGEAWKIIK